VGIAPASKGVQHGEAAPKTRARSSESEWKLWSSVKGEVPMKKRNDPPGYPDDDRITQWYNELKEMVREELGLSEVEHVMRSTYEDAVRRCAPIRRAIGILFRAVREERKLTRPEMAEQSNVPARENSGELKEGRATFCLGT
jgi:hypothetical protein